MLRWTVMRRWVDGLARTWSRRKSCPAICLAIARPIAGNCRARPSPISSDPSDSLKLRLPLCADDAGDDHLFSATRPSNPDARRGRRSPPITMAVQAAVAAHGRDHEPRTYHPLYADARPGIQHVLHGWSDMPEEAIKHELIVGDTFIRNVTTDIRFAGVVSRRTAIRSSSSRSPASASAISATCITSSLRGTMPRSAGSTC